MNRVLTAIGLIAVTLYLVFWSHPYVFLGAAVLMGLLCYREFSSLVTGHGIRPPGILGVLGGLLILFWPAHALIGLTLLLLVSFASALRFENLRDVLPNAACILLGSFYTFAPWHYAVELRSQSVHLLFFALSLNWAGDSVAYYVGRSIGKHKLAPVVSPKKSWEGAIASVLGSVILGLIYLGYFVPSIALWKIAIIAAIANVAGQVGDLAESAVKRGAGVKDSGTLLPGHGGMLDRVDSSLFALPVAYVLMVVLRVASK
jgi:phosphatidate cytidylyltransferase